MPCPYPVPLFTHLQLSDVRSLMQGALGSGSGSGGTPPSPAAAGASDPDAELRQMAEEEAAQLGGRLLVLEQELLLALLPGAQDEGRGAILEVRGA